MTSPLAGILPPVVHRQLSRLRRDFDRRRLAHGLPKADPDVASPTDRAAVFGFHRASIGVGRGAAMCALELQAQGVKVERIDVTPLMGLPCDIESLDDPRQPASAPLILAVNPDVLAHALSRYGPGVLQRRRVIAYWVYELPRAPKDWALLQHIAHEVWAPSAFAAQAIAQTIGRPVQVVPHPVALAPPSSPALEAVQRLREGLGLSPEGFLVFFTFSASSSPERKNPVGAIKAFVDAFRGFRDAKLVVRCLHGDRHPAAMRPVEAAAREAGGLVTLLQRDGASAAHGEAERDLLYAACDAYISLHRSEGFGLTLAEAMLAERAVIATGWSGNLEFMDDRCAALVPHRMTSVREPLNLYTDRSAFWADPDHDAAVELLRALQKDQLKRAAMAIAGRHRVLRDLSGGAAVARLTQAVAQ